MQNHFHDWIICQHLTAGRESWQLAGKQHGAFSHLISGYFSRGGCGDQSRAKGALNVRHVFLPHVTCVLTQQSSPIKLFNEFTCVCSIRCIKWLLPFSFYTWKDVQWAGHYCRVDVWLLKPDRSHVLLRRRFYFLTTLWSLKQLVMVLLVSTGLDWRYLSVRLVI